MPSLSCSGVIGMLDSPSLMKSQVRSFFLSVCFVLVCWMDEGKAGDRSRLSKGEIFALLDGVSGCAGNRLAKQVIEAGSAGRLSCRLVLTAASRGKANYLRVASWSSYRQGPFHSYDLPGGLPTVYVPPSHPMPRGCLEQHAVAQWFTSLLLIVAGKGRRVLRRPLRNRIDMCRWSARSPLPGAPRRYSRPRSAPGPAR